MLTIPIYIVINFNRGLQGSKLIPGRTSPIAQAVAQKM